MAKPRKKKNNPRIVPKKKNTKPKTRRKKSPSHLKGWQTRRINQLAALQGKAVVKPTKKSDKKKSAKKKPKALSRKEMAGEISRLKRVIREKWVYSDSDEWLHEDGTIAVHSSRLRHKKVTDAVYAEMKRFRAAGDEHGLQDYVRFWAAEWDIPIQEFYTLLMSP